MNINNYYSFELKVSYEKCKGYVVSSNCIYNANQC